MEINISLLNGLIRFFFVIVIFPSFYWHSMVKARLRPIIFDLIVKNYILFWISICIYTLWLGNYYEIFSTNLVINTFAGPLNLIGALDRPGGFYDPIYINNYDMTNIFKKWRLGKRLFNFWVINDIIYFRVFLSK